MSRLTALNPETTTGKSKDLFTAIQGKLGMVVCYGDVDHLIPGQTDQAIS